jgi:hypothetical protein
MDQHVIPELSDDNASLSFGLAIQDFHFVAYGSKIEPGTSAPVFSGSYCRNTNGCSVATGPPEYFIANFQVIIDTADSNRHLGFSIPGCGVRPGWLGRSYLTLDRQRKQLVFIRRYLLLFRLVCGTITIRHNKGKAQ